MESGSKTHVRKGKKKDIPAALNLIRELALYEKAPDEVEVTVEEMLNWGFGKEKLFDFFVAEKATDKKKQIIGIALYYFKYSTWKGKCVFLDDIIVNEKFRRQGIGHLLFGEIVKMSKKLKVRKLEWQVLDWNKPAIDFYKKYNAFFDEEWINCKLNYNQIQKFK